MSTIKLFRDKKIRIHWNKSSQKWYFSVIDVVEVPSESTNPRRYWSHLKRKLTKEGFNQLYEIIVQLKLASTDGKRHTTDCADAKGLLCIIQSISFPKAEPFKSRLTPKVGAEMTGGR